MLNDQFDNFLPIKNSFYLGEFQQTIQELKNGNDSIEKQILFLRCKLIQEPSFFNNFINSSNTPEINLIKIIAAFLLEQINSVDAQKEVKSLISSTDVLLEIGEGGGLPILAGQFYYIIKEYGNALEILQMREMDLEWFFSFIKAHQ